MLQHMCCPVNFLHIFRIPFSKNTSGGLFLNDKNSFLFFSKILHFLIFKKIVEDLEDLKVILKFKTFKAKPEIKKVKFES